MTIYFLLNEVVFASIEGVKFLLMFQLINNKTSFMISNKFKTLVMIAFYTLFSYTSTMLAPGVINTLLHVIFTTAIFSYFAKNNIYASFLSSLVTMIFTAVVELSCVMAYINAAGISLNALLANPEHKLVSLIITRFIELVIIAFFYKSRFRSPFSHSFLQKQHRTISFILLQLAFTALLLVASLSSRHSSYFIGLSTLIYTFIVFLGYYDMKERDKMLQAEKKFLVQQEYIKNMEVVVDIIRKEKHEFANHLSTLIAMCMLKKPDTLEKVEAYAKKLIKSTSSGYNFFDTGNTYVDGLLAVKSNYASEHDIHLSVDFDDPLDMVLIDDVDLTSIIGNIIDNAFDAVAANSGQSKKIVSLYACVENNTYTILISNNGTKIDEKNISKIFEKNYTTKKSPHNAQRGYGLFIVKQLLDKYNGKISVTSTENETQFQIEFSIKKVPLEKARTAV